MQVSGNGLPQQCIANLLNLYQFEVSYARLKGMDPSIVDLPKDEAEVAAKNHATWLIENYEPRVTVNDVAISYTDEGRMIITPDITVNEV